MTDSTLPQSSSSSLTPFIVIGSIFIALVVIGSFFLSTKQSSLPQLSMNVPSIVPLTQPIKNLSPINMPASACDTDAKVCANGSVVSRSGPNCEFALCPEENLGPPITPTPSAMAKDCAVGGCSGELCGDAYAVDQMLSTCDYKEEYSCLKKSRCERQSNGKCGWTQTPEYAQCLATVLE